MHIDERAGGGGLPLAELQWVAAQLTLALEAMHAMEMIHRDIKPSNVIMDRHGYWALSDFGLSSRLGVSSCSGTRGFWSPETVRRETQHPTADWWSCGVTLWFAACGKHPFHRRCREVEGKLVWPPLPVRTDEAEDVPAPASGSGGGGSGGGGSGGGSGSGAPVRDRRTTLQHDADALTRKMAQRSEQRKAKGGREAEVSVESGAAPDRALSPGGPPDSESGGDSSPVRPPSPPPIPVEFVQSLRMPMAKTLSFARRKPSKEEEAELFAATPDKILSPGSAQLLRSALQAEADEGVSSSLVCPITCELMTDPVFTMDGQVTQTQTLALTLTLTLTPTLTLALTLTLTLTRRTSARPSRRGCATTTPRPPPASRCPTRSSSRTYAREACCASYPSGRSGRRRASV